MNTLKKSIVLRCSSQGRFSIYQDEERIYLSTSKDREDFKKSINEFIDSMPIEHESISMAKSFSNSIKLSKFDVKYLYILKSNDLYKIGKTKDIVGRMVNYKTHNPSFTLIHITAVDVKTNDIDLLEKDTLENFSSYSIGGCEWFNFDEPTLQRVINHINFINMFEV